MYTLEEAAALAAIRTAKYVHYIWVLFLTVVLVSVFLLGWLVWRELNECSNARTTGAACTEQMSFP